MLVMRSSDLSAMFACAEQGVLPSCPKSIPQLGRSLQGEGNNWRKGRTRIEMRNLRLTFWGLAALVTMLWLLADLSIFRSSGFFAIRSAAVQYSGALAIACMSVAMMLAIRPRWPGHGRGGLDKMDRCPKRPRSAAPQRRDS